MILGNLGADPELRVVAGGQAILRMRIATSETYLDRSNNRQERTEWHSVAVWGRRAEALAKFLTKGARIFVEGSLRTSSYEKDGEKRYRTEVVAKNVLFANARGETERTEERASGRAGQGREAPPPPPQDWGDYSGTDDDIPF
jgi:single-strand DNA-binding protein